VKNRLCKEKQGDKSGYYYTRQDDDAGLDQGNTLSGSDFKNNKILGLEVWLKQ
jgi:hypothetical protein